MAAQSLHAEQFSRVRRIFPVVFTLIAGLSLTGVAFKIIQGLERERLKLDFEVIALSQARSLNERIHRWEDALHTMRNLFMASEHVSNSEFELLSNDLRSRQSGIHSFRWLCYVRGPDREATERSAKANVDPGWRIHEGVPGPDQLPQPAEVRDHHLPALYVAPARDATMELGFDHFQGPFQQAIQQAIETGTIAATQRIRLQTNQTGEYGWVAVLAIYKKERNPATPQERWDALEGVLMGEFRIGELLNGEIVDSSRAPADCPDRRNARHNGALSPELLPGESGNGTSTAGQ
jgi:CHASE1-domain containing sensor protein